MYRFFDHLIYLYTIYFICLILFDSLIHDFQWINPTLDESIARGSLQAEHVAQGRQQASQWGVAGGTLSMLSM